MRESKRNTAVIIANERGYSVLADGSVESPTGTILKTRPDSNGYLRFTIKDSGMSLTVYVHKLAAFQRFGGIIFDEDQEVRHLDNNNANNADYNVSFGSHSENMMDLSAAMRMHNAMAGSRLSRKLSTAQVQELRALREDGWSLRQLCRKYHLALSTVSYIVNRKTYYDV